MELFDNLALGFAVAFTVPNLLFALLGCLIGTLIAVLPGIGPVAAVAMLLPATYALDATPALIMLAGICYGAQYGSTTTAILADVASGPAAVAMATDGRQMVRQGRAGAALAVAVLGVFAAGCVGTLAIAVLAAPLTEIAFRFGPAEYFSLLLLGLVGAASAAPGSRTKAIAMAVVGLLLAQVGADPLSGAMRYGFGFAQLEGGIGVVVVAMGIVVVAEVIARLGRPASSRELLPRPVERSGPTRDDMRQAWPAVVRGTSLGAIVGAVPGGGALLASLAAYSVERRLAGAGGRFGRGDVRGVAGPASAGSASAHTSFVPMLAFGIPVHAVMALLIGAMLIKGIEPGPQVMASDPQLFWGLIASMWIGNALLAVVELPLVGIRRRLLPVPHRALAPVVALIACVGVYSLRGSAFDVGMTALFALVGYAMHKLSCEPAPLLIGFILGPAMEGNLRQALLLSHGDWGIFVDRPLSAGLLVLSTLIVVIASLPAARRRREDAFVED